MNDAQGHRSRLQERYKNGGVSALQDYELLELLLALLIPRKDTKPMAKALLRRFTSISAVLAADPRELSEIEGIGERTALMLHFVRDMSSYCLKEEYHGKEYIASQQDVQEYLKFHYAHLPDEYAVVLFMDNRNRVIHTEVIAEGTVDHCTIYPRKIFDRAFRLGGAGVLLAHNHPGGSATPSRADWNITGRLYEAGKLLDIELLDHIIVADGTIVSLRALSEWPGSHFVK